MSWLSRLRGAGPAPAREAPGPALVSIDAALAAELAEEGRPLVAVVEGVLREYLRGRAPGAASAQQGIPFWLAREDQRAGGFDDGLRDRVVQRQGEADR